MSLCVAIINGAPCVRQATPPNRNCIRCETELRRSAAVRLEHQLRKEELALKAEQETRRLALQHEREKERSEKQREQEKEREEKQRERQKERDIAEKEKQERLLAIAEQEHAMTLALEEERRKRLIAEEEDRRKEAKTKADKEAKARQRQEILEQQINEAILEVRDLESLRRLELKIMEGLVSGVIDSKAGSPLSQMLKHQAALLPLTVGREDGSLQPHERDAAVQIAINMPPDQMLALLADFGNGMRGLIKQARTEPPAITIQAREVEGCS